MSRTMRRARIAAALAVCAVALAACGSGDDGGGDGKGSDTASPSPAHTPPPPVAFDPEPTFTLSDSLVTWSLPAALHELTAFQADLTGVSVFDLESGEQTTRVEPEHTPLWVTDYAPPEAENPSMLSVMEHRRAIHAPEFAETPNGPALISAFPVELPGGPGVELFALHADSGETLWRHTFEAENWAADPPELHGAAFVWGTDGDVVAIQLTNDSLMTTTYGISLNDGSVVWADDEVYPLAAHDGLLIGRLEGADGRLTDFVALTLAEGNRVWDAPMEFSGSATQAGPWVSVGDFDSDNAQLLSISDGSTFLTEADGLPLRASCALEESTGVVVCDGRDGAAIGLDTASGEVLWSLPADGEEWKGRTTATWGGLLFVSRHEDTPVTLDARTGTPLDTSPNLAPNAVNDHGALVYSDFTVTFHTFLATED